MSYGQLESEAQSNKIVQTYNVIITYLSRRAPAAGAIVSNYNIIMPCKLCQNQILHLALFPIILTEKH